MNKIEVNLVIVNTLKGWDNRRRNTPFFLRKIICFEVAKCTFFAENFVKLDAVVQTVVKSERDAPYESIYLRFFFVLIFQSEARSLCSAERLATAQPLKGRISLAPDLHRQGKLLIILDTCSRSLFRTFFCHATNSEG